MAWPNIRLEQTAGKSRFNVKLCRGPVQLRAAAQAGRYGVVLKSFLLGRRCEAMLLESRGFD